MAVVFSHYALAYINGKVVVVFSTVLASLQTGTMIANQTINQIPCTIAEN